MYPALAEWVRSVDAAIEVLAAGAHQDDAMIAAMARVRAARAKLEPMMGTGAPSHYGGQGSESTRTPLL